MSARVYVPLSAADLATLVGEGRLVGPRAAHAVTAGLREAWPEADEESWEYAALMAAAAASRPGHGRRRVVAVDVARVEPAGPGPAGSPAAGPEGDDPTRVVVPGDLVWKGVAAAHVDIEDGADDDDDLAWFATQEIAGLGSPS